MKIVLYTNHQWKIKIIPNLKKKVWTMFLEREWTYLDIKRTLYESV